MHQITRVCYFADFAKQVRLVNAKVTLSVLIAILVILATMLIVLHTISSGHVPVFFADSDPWNG